ncbi:hypothetical protein ACFSW8_10750 [Rubritalea tangerina]|uniref:SLA1 homology domain-containing protein n=2 Tax=Rubritalea tangerina TaxID=430798 RepID=A0ABW4ZBL2_9BACT
MKSSLVKKSVLPAVFVGSALLLGARTWTDVKGRKIEADIVSKTTSAVVVKKKGKEITIPLVKLSQADRDFVAGWEAPSDEVVKKDEGKVTDAKVEEYFNLPWPKLISADNGLEIEETSGPNETYVYRSPNYEFVSDTKLSKVVVKRFAVLFEATRLYVQQMPYASLKAYKEGANYKVMLFDSMNSYHRAGGPVGSAGVYIPSKDIIMVPCQSLGLVRRGSSWALDYDKTNKTLPHEITHQLTDREYYAPGARGWFSEGFAEYIAATPYRSGKFTANKAESSIEQYVTNFSKKDGRGRNLGTEINAPDLKKFMMMSYGEFTANGNFNYGLGALLVTYFNHYDGEGDGENLKNFLRALKAGKKGEEALEALRAGRSFEELEADITKGWRKRGVKINFG